MGTGVGQKKFEMNRRQFLRYSVYGGVSLALGNLISCAETIRIPKVTALFGDIQIIDAHAHPDWDCQCSASERPPYTSTIKYMKELGMVASCFAAIGDQVYTSRGRLRDNEYGSTMTQLNWWKGDLRSGKIKLVLKASDVPKAIGPDSPPGAILSIEGGDPLEGEPDRVNKFWQYGVRMITLIHSRNNEIGDLMAPAEGVPPGPRNNGLTPAGRRVVERMQELGMVVDVAHADSATLKQIAEMTERPLLDSHTCPCFGEDPMRCRRFRTWKDMELVAKTGGVVCTWSQGYKSSRTVRMTFTDWAQEILEMKRRLGIAHVGLGTDGGWPSFPSVKGYQDIRDLTDLMAAMKDVGFSHDEIAAYMGGNLLGLLRSCIG
jgi:microsomal dipeptidase-like Zn-dependent dipeptidase